MARAKAFSRLEVERREKEAEVEKAEVDPAVIDKLVRRVGVTDKAKLEQLRYKLRCTIEAYRARVRADKQEHPARMVAALKPGLKTAKDLLEWLNSLPVGVLTALQAGSIQTSLEAIIPTIENRVDYWPRHVAAHRPDGAGDASLDLRRSLTDIITAHRPDPPNATEQQKRFKEQRRRDWVAFACHEIGARFPHQKKRRRQFIGEHQRKTPGEVKDAIAPEPSEAERRLKDTPI
jgi:hypothetical protein